jgi:hypothetical protein
MLNPSINRRTLSARTRFLVPFLALTFLLPLAALRLTAQNLSGKVSGSIHNPSGTGVANATIIMSNHAGDTIDMITMTTSDRDGNFSFKALRAGEYELKVMKRGFEPFRLPQVTLESGRDFSQSITLQIGAIMEEVEVVPNGTANPLPSGATSKPSRIRVGVTLAPSHYESSARLSESVRSAGVSGIVILHAIISKDGKPFSSGSRTAKSLPTSLFPPSKPSASGDTVPLCSMANLSKLTRRSW